VEGVKEIGHGPKQKEAMRINHMPFYPEVAGRTFVRNFGKYLPDYMESHLEDSHLHVTEIER
jgi:hypothetical protein